MSTEVIDKPIEQKTEIVNPVLKESDLDISKKIFNEQKAKAQAAPPEDKMIEQDVSRMKPKAKKQPEQPKVEETIPPVADPKSEKSPPKQDSDKAHTELPEDIFQPASEKKEEAPVVTEIDAMELPKGAKPESVASFSKLKEISKSQIAKLQTELEQLKSRNGGNGDLEVLKKELTDYRTKYGELEERFGRELYTASPQFQANFIEKEQAAITGAKAYLDGSDVEPGIVDMIVHLPPKKRAETLAERGVDQYAAGGILAELSRYDGVQRDKSKAIENWKTDVARSVEQQTLQQQEQESKRKEQEENVWKEAISNLDLIPLRKSKDETWNSRGGQILERAKQMFNGDTDLKTLAVNQIKGEAYDALNDVVTSLVGQLKDVRAENAKLKANKPGGEMTQGIPGKTDAQKHEGMSREESAKSIFNMFKAQNQGGV